MDGWCEGSLGQQRDGLGCEIGRSGELCCICG